MRKHFAELLFNEMKINSDIVLITADLGYKMWDRISHDFPGRFYNVGSAEQLMVGAGVGMALSGKLPILYSITPFLLYRPFEFIRNYLDHEKICVKLVGSGRDKDYCHDGFSHWAEEDAKTLFPNIIHFLPENIEELTKVFKSLIYNNSPCYLSLRR